MTSGFAGSDRERALALALESSDHERKLAKEEVLKLQWEVSRGRKEVVSKDDILHSMRRDARRRGEELQGLRQEKDGLSKQLMAVTLERNKEGERRKREVQGLKGELEELRRKLDMALEGGRVEGERKQKQIQDLEGELGVVKTREEVSGRLLKGMNGLFEKKELELEELTGKKGEEIEALQKELDVAKAAARTAQGEVEAMTQEYRRMGAGMADTIDQFQALQNEYERKKGEVEALKIELQLAKKNCQGLEEKLEELRRKVAREEFYKPSLEQEVEGLRKQLTNALEEVRKVQKQLTEKEELRKLAEQKSTRLVKIIDTLEKEAGLKQVKFQELKKELTTVKGQKALLELKQEHATELLKSKEDTIFWKDMELDGLRKLTEMKDAGVMTDRVGFATPMVQPTPPVGNDEGSEVPKSSSTSDKPGAKDFSLGTPPSGAVASASTTSSAVGTTASVVIPTGQEGHLGTLDSQQWHHYYDYYIPSPPGSLVIAEDDDSFNLSANEAEAEIESIGTSQEVSLGSSQAELDNEGGKDNANANAGTEGTTTPNGSAPLQPRLSILATIAAKLKEELTSEYDSSDDDDGEVEVLEPEAGQGSAAVPDAGESAKSSQSSPRVDRTNTKVKEPTILNKGIQNVAKPKGNQDERTGKTGDLGLGGTKRKSDKEIMGSFQKAVKSAMDRTVRPKVPVRQDPESDDDDGVSTDEEAEPKKAAAAAAGSSKSKFPKWRRRIESSSEESEDFDDSEENIEVESSSSAWEPSPSSASSSSSSSSEDEDLEDYHSSSSQDQNHHNQQQPAKDNEGYQAPGQNSQSAVASSSKSAPTVPNQSVIQHESQPRPVRHGLDDDMPLKFAVCVCGETFDKWGHLRDHISYHVDDPKACHICGKRVRGRANFRRHIREHRLEKKWKKKARTSSSQKFSSGSHDQNQTTTPHGLSHVGTILCVRKGPDGRKKSANEIRYFCRCGRYFYPESKLNTHVRVMRVGRIFVCPICRRSFYHHYHLRIHVEGCHGMRYTRENACSECAATFQTVEELAGHRKFAHPPSQ